MDEVVDDIARKSNKRRKNKDNPVDILSRKEPSADKSGGNVHCSSFEWSQTDQEITLILQFDEDLENGRISANCKSQLFTVNYKGLPVWKCTFLHAVKEGKIAVSRLEGRALRFTVSKQVPGITWPTLEKQCHLKVQYDQSERDRGEKDVYAVNFCKHDTFETADRLTLEVYVKHITKDTLEVTFHESSFAVEFETSDQHFLSLHPPCTSATRFAWRVNLSGSIDVTKCRFSLSAMRLEIVFLKIGQWSWLAIESPAINKPAPKTADNLGTSGVALNTWLPASPTASENKTTADVSANMAGVQGKIDKFMKFSGSKEQKELTKKPTCMVSPLTKSNTEDSRVKGLTGLDNLGNTCFMNSVIQCLVNTREFRDYFLRPHLQCQINTENPLGSGGKLAVSFAVLCNNLWSSSNSSYSPSKLKNVVEMKANQFTGFAQHDAQEFMAFLLDGLHEDLNRVRNPPYTANIDSDGRPDEVVADEAWSVYKKRNDSVVVDLFQGQFKSKLVCPVCKKVSITFDPFLYLSVPLPRKQTTIRVVFFAKDPFRRPVKLVVQMPFDSTMEQFKEHISRRTSVRPANLRIFEVYKSKLHKWFTNGSHLSAVETGDIIFVFEVLGEELDGEPVLELYVIQRIVMPQPLTVCSFCKRERPQAEPKLKRCTNCYKASYCDQTCQKNHWGVHKANCRSVPEPVGCPFIISLPKSQITFSKLCQMMEAFARYSVDVFKPPSETGESLGLQRSTGSSVCLEPSTNMDANVSDDAPASTESPVEMNTPQSTTSATRAVVGKLMSEYVSPPFSVVPVNASGVNLAGVAGSKLTDNGDKPLNIQSNCYLAMDWNNNDKSKNCVMVQTKVLDVDEDNKAGGSGDPSANTTLEQCLQLFTEPEVLSPEEAWYCPNCKQHREATKQLSLWRLPTVLIVQLKRFSFKNFMYRDKIDKMVEFPIRDLNLAPFCSAQKQNTTPPPIYDLYAVINHHGSILGGHYTACGRVVDNISTRRNEVDWRIFDDSRVSFTSESKIMTKAAYVLFYRRRDVIFQPPLPAVVEIPKPLENYHNLSTMDFENSQVIREPGDDREDEITNFDALD